MHGRAIGLARERINANVAPLLAPEAMALSLRVEPRSAGGCRHGLVWCAEAAPPPRRGVACAGRSPVVAVLAPAAIGLGVRLDGHPARPRGPGVAERARHP